MDNKSTVITTMLFFITVQPKTPKVTTGRIIMEMMMKRMVMMVMRVLIMTTVISSNHCITIYVHK